MFTVRRAEECRELRLNNELRKGEATVVVRVRDEAGKSQELAAQSLVFRENHPEFPLASLPSGSFTKQMRLSELSPQMQPIFS